MGTLPIIMIKGFRLKILPAHDAHHRLFPVLVFVITLMIGMQAPMISCSGNVHLANRPYLFRDYEMLTSYHPPQRSHHENPTLFVHNSQQQKSDDGQDQEQYAADQSIEDGSSEEGEETRQYTAPVILDIDDPEMKARWMGLSDQQSFEEFYDEYEDGEGEEQERSLSSTEFMSRSSQQIRSSGEDNKSDKSQSASKSSKDGEASSGSGKAGDESRGIMDNFSFNPFSYWQGDEEAQSGERPQSDEFQDYGSFHPSYYDARPIDYYYDGEQNDQKKPMMPHLVPVQKVPKKKPKAPRPKTKPKKKKPSKKVKKPKAPKQKPAFPPPMKMKKKKPSISQQFHYQQEGGKPGKLEILSDKLSKLNPFRYVHLQKPQIKIEKYEDGPHGPPQHGGGGPHGHGHGPPPKRMKKPKRPPPRPHHVPPHPPPKKQEKPPSMMQAVINKISPSKSSKHKQAKPQKPQHDESNPEFEIILGEPFGHFQADEVKDDGEDYRDGSQEDDDNENDDEDDDDDDDEEDEEEDDEEDDQVMSIPDISEVSHQEGPNGEMSEGIASDDQEGEEAETAQRVVIEDDEGDYADDVIGLTNPETEAEDADGDDQKEKSIFGWRKKKRRRHRKRHPARRPPNYKQYRPAPLLPEIPHEFGDALMTVIKHVGFLPEYDKVEKYGGHNKVKGKFTKTRPITLHHGLLTEVLRRR